MWWVGRKGQTTRQTTTRGKSTKAQRETETMQERMHKRNAQKSTRKEKKEQRTIKEGTKERKSDTEKERVTCPKVPSSQTLQMHAADARGATCRDVSCCGRYTARYLLIAYSSEDF